MPRVKKKRAWEEVKAYVQERMNSGAQYFIIDGQNRLNEALVPLFKSDLAFGDEKIEIEGSDGSYCNLAGPKV